jgi:hypothetical protein
VSKLIGDRLPAAVFQAFDGNDLERKIGPAYLLITSDPDGTARPCMLSAGEILALDDKRIRVALWPRSNTSANLARGSPALLCYVVHDSALYVKGIPRALGKAARSRLERFEIEVRSVESDIHPGMPVNEGITFALEGATPAEVAATWHEQVEGLREG